MYKKGLVFALTTAGVMFANPYKDWYLSVQAYVTYINYSNSGQKKWGVAGTLYGSLSLKYGTHIFEGAISNIHLEYKDNLTDWNQSDYALAYTNYQLFPWYGKVGFHYIATPNNHFSENGKIFFGDLGYISRYRWDGGLFVSYSDYKLDIAAFQSRLHGGFYRWIDYYSGFYFSGDLNWINLNNEKFLGITKKNFVSLGLGITYFNYYYKLSAYAWGGERTLMVDNGGFVVYNLREKYRGGLKLSGTYYLRSNLWIGAEVGYGNYKELSDDKSVNVVTATLTVGYSF